MYLIWAIGSDIPSSDGTAFGKHSQKGVSYVNLTASSTCPPSPPADTDAPISHKWTSASQNFAMTWSVVDQKWIDVTVVGMTKGWVGVGLTDTNSMLYSDMVVGWVGDSDGKAVVYDMYTGDKRGMPDFDSQIGGTDDVQLISGSQVTLPTGDVQTTLRWRRLLITADNFDLDIVDRDFYVLYAIGANDGKSDGTFYEHREKGIVRMNLKVGSVNSTVEAWVENPRTTLRSSHGALMVIGWIFFMTIGRFIASYGRKVPYWWQIHVTFQALSMLCISLSVALILKAVGSQGKHFGSAHGIFGIVLVVAAFVQTALGAMAHFLRTTHSPIFPNQIHQYLGHIIWWAAIYNIPLGLRQYQIAPFTHEGNAFWAVWAVWILIMVSITVFIFYMKWVDHKQKQEDQARQRAQGEADPYDIYTTSHYDPSLINSLERVEKAPPSLVEIITGNKVMTGGVVLHIALALALALLFTTLANTRPAPPFHFCPNCTEVTLKFNEFNIKVGAHPAKAVPATQSFFCKGFDLGISNTRHIVEVNPSVTSGYATHMTLFAVPYDTAYLGTFACLDALDEAVPIYTWSVGQGPFSLPAQAGIRVGAGTSIRYVVLQIRYDNPQLSSSLYDSSGIVVKMTSTLRPHDAGVMAIGVAPNTIAIDPNDSEFEITGQCSSEKTSLLTESLNVFLVSHDTRKYGIVAWLEQWTPSSITHLVSFSNLIGQSFAQSPYNPVVASSSSHAVIRPGDALISHCIYDTRSTNTTVFGGNDAFDEHCWTWLWYYPKTDAIRCYSSQTVLNPADGHFRPDYNTSIIL